MERKFSSFEEIDARLQNLRLQRELSLQRLRHDLSHNPVEILRDGIRRVRPALNNLAIDWMRYQLRGLRRKIRPDLPKLP